MEHERKLKRVTTASTPSGRAQQMWRSRHAHAADGDCLRIISDLKFGLCRYGCVHLFPLRHIVLLAKSHS